MSLTSFQGHFSTLYEHEHPDTEIPGGIIPPTSSSVYLLIDVSMII